MNREIEKAGAEHAEAIWNLRCTALRTQGAGHYDEKILAAWAGGSMPENFPNEIAKGCYIIREGERVIAFGLVALNTGRIEAVFVDPDCFGRGYGRRMVEHLQTLAQAHGVTHLSLNASLNAAGFYRALGYTGDAIGKHHSPRGYILDCVPMEKQLAPN